MQWLLIAIFCLVMISMPEESEFLTHQRIAGVQQCGPFTVRERARCVYYQVTNNLPARICPCGATV
jgi:hypothetical protein